MEQSPQPPATAEAAYEQEYKVLSRIMARVFNKVITRHESASEKTWADVGGLQHMTQIMQELDDFMGNKT